MASRKIIRIDEELCNGCGLCVPACAEGALQIVDGKARLVLEKYCDGLGACLGECPQGAIAIEERDAAEFDEAAVERHLAERQKQKARDRLPGECPGSAVRTLEPRQVPETSPTPTGQSTLRHWPVQLMLVPIGAPFLQGADILVCADCVPFTVPDFHSRYLNGRAVLVGCPKLDDLDLYRNKLTDIFSAAEPASITVLRMEVPCCGGIAQAVIQARNQAVLRLPVEIHTLGIRGGSHREISPGRAAAAEGGAG